MADPYLALKTYFGDIFYQPFTADRREMIDAIIHAAIYGGDQAVAGPRGDGKTRSALFCTLMLILRRQVWFPMIISKSGPRAARELRNLKYAMQSSPALAADFPEVITPIIALGGWGARARQQTVYGQPTNMEWGDECVILPTVKTETLRANGWNEDIESAACGQILASLGIEGPIRGYSVRNKRPDLAILDDLDDRESARSDLQTENRERIIEEDIGGLAGPDKTISRAMLCTLINHSCIAATYTDRTKKGSWRGQRHKLLTKWPERLDLWEEYMRLRSERTEDDPDARVAHNYYLARRAEMDAGAETTNPYRFDKRELADGSQAEVSALQYCFNIICDRGRESFDTEYQNDPPQEVGPVESGITPHRVQRQLYELDRRHIPAGCKVVLAQGIDCSKAALHWVVRAYRIDGSGFFTIDYGITEVIGTKYGSDEGVDLAIYRAILNRMEETRETEYIAEADGELLPVGLTLVDAGWQTEAVYRACRTIGHGIRPIMGFGKSSGCTQAKFSDVLQATKDKQPGDGYFLKKRGKNLVLVCSDADRWKAWEHDRWMTVPTKPGSMQLFGVSSGTKELSADEKAHHTYAHHICNEIEIEEFVKGKHRRRWMAKGANHWLDASCYANVAAALQGVRLLRCVARAIAAETKNTGAGQGVSPETAPRPVKNAAVEFSAAQHPAKKGPPKRKVRKATPL